MFAVSKLMNTASVARKLRKCLVSMRFYRDNVKTVLIYGDSNTWGYSPEHCRNITRFSYNERWTTVVQRSLGDGVNVVVDALSARTTIHDDKSSPCDGDYDCNGRKFLTNALHTHKPLDVVVLALGANDLKSKFHASAHDIVAGVRILIKDVRRATDVGIHTYEKIACARGVPSFNEYKTPKILVLSPPIIKQTSIGRIWGFDDHSEKKSRKVCALLSVAMKDMDGVEFINMSQIASVSAIDGVHFPLSEQKRIGEVVATKLVSMLAAKDENRVIVDV